VGGLGGSGGFLVWFLVMLFGVGLVKRQVGVRVDVELWDAYKRICACEGLWSNVGVEGFLRVVVGVGSVLSALRLLQRAVDAGVEGFDDYARVLLSWYRGGRSWVYVEGRQVAVDGMLLLALKAVSDSRLRGEIREALMQKREEGASETGDGSAVKEESTVEDGVVLAEGGLPAASKRLRDIAKDVSGRELGAEQAELMLKKIDELRRKLKLGRESET
jgi:hypothetical protein